jgi:hypothetical protein
MLEDKYTGNQHFVNYDIELQTNEMKQKLDNIHSIIHNNYKNKKNNVNQMNFQPIQNQEIQSNEVIQSQNKEQSLEEKVLKNDYVDQFQAHQHVQEQKKQIVQAQEEVAGYESKNVIQSQADLSPSLEQGNFQNVQTQENQHQEIQTHQPQEVNVEPQNDIKNLLNYEHIPKKQIQQQEQHHELLSNNLQRQKNPENPHPFHNSEGRFAIYESQDSQLPQLTQPKETNKKVQNNEEVLSKQKKDDINIMIILVIFALIFLF